MFPGETILSGADQPCTDCGTMLPFQVFHSGAGYYIGTMCQCCGPYSRESEYWPTREGAEHAFKTGLWTPRGEGLPFADMLKSPVVATRVLGDEIYRVHENHLMEIAIIDNDIPRVFYKKVKPTELIYHDSDGGAFNYEYRPEKK